MSAYSISKGHMQEGRWTLTRIIYTKAFVEDRDMIIPDISSADSGLQAYGAPSKSS